VSAKNNSGVTGTVQTTILETKTVLTIPIPVSSSGLITVAVVGHNTTTTYVATKTFFARSDNAGAITLGTVVDLIAQLLGAVVAVTTGSGTVVIQVTGLALTTIDWMATATGPVYQP